MLYMSNHRENLGDEVKIWQKYHQENQEDIGPVWKIMSFDIVNFPRREDGYAIYVYILFLLMLYHSSCFVFFI